MGLSRFGWLCKVHFLKLACLNLVLIAMLRVVLMFLTFVMFMCRMEKLCMRGDDTRIQKI